MKDMKVISKDDVKCNMHSEIVSTDPHGSRIGVKIVSVFIVGK